MAVRRSRGFPSRDRSLQRDRYREAKMAEFMNANIPGVSVPQEMIDELRAAGPERAEDVGVFFITKYRSKFSFI